MAFVPWSDVSPGPDRGVGRVVVYALIDPRDETVRYVGVTSARLDVRLARHLRKPSNRGVAEWFAELGRAGLGPAIRFLCRPVRWDEGERWWIAWFRARGALLNAHGGGAWRDGRGRVLGVPGGASAGGSPTKKQRRRLRRIMRVDAAQDEVRRRSGVARVLGAEEVAAISAALTPPREIARGTRSAAGAPRTWRA